MFASWVNSKNPVCERHQVNQIRTHTGQTLPLDQLSSTQYRPIGAKMYQVLVNTESYYTFLHQGDNILNTN